MSGGGKRRHHEEEHEEHENHERWLVSYADMMTLLMVLFIVMFAISQVDSKKFMALKTGLSAGFGAPVAILSGGDQLLDPGGAVAPDSVNLSGSASGKTRSADVDPQTSVDPQKVARLATATEHAQVKQEVSNLKQAEQKLKQALQKSGMSSMANFRFNERGLVVTVATDNVLFTSGSAQLQPQGQHILDTLAPTLNSLPNNLSIEGHTDSSPIHTAQFPSNWELSGARASGVLRYLHASAEIPYDRMSFAGYADTQPRYRATDPRAMTANRRVEIVILARVDDSAGRAVESLGNQSSDPTDGTSATTDRLPAAASEKAAETAAAKSSGTTKAKSSAGKASRRGASSERSGAGTSGTPVSVNPER